MLFGFAWDTSSPLAFAWSILPVLLQGMLVTIDATLVCFIVAAIIGLILAGLKCVRLIIISGPAYFITAFIRDTPLLVQLFFLYYVLPEYGIVLPAFMTGALALGLQYSAYTTEAYRAGIESIHHGRTEAARAREFTAWRTVARVILPRAIPR